MRPGRVTRTGTLSTGEVTLTGCWRYNEPVVSVYWRESGESRQYQAGAFTITDGLKNIYDGGRTALPLAGMQLGRRPSLVLAAVVLIASAWSALAVANLDRVVAILAFAVDRI